MSHILNTLVNVIEPHQQRPIWVAFSGGIDSQVLLHALVEVKRNRLPDLDLHVCHVHHGLSKKADYWQQFAENTCKALKLPLVCQRVILSVNARESLEAVARDARYQVFKDICHDNAIILTGHHQEDQWETLLLALKRGSGIQGLGAMPMLSETDHANQLLCRPLLNVAKQEINAYAEQHALDWIEDESNHELRFDRNFIRHQVTPLISKRWPSFVSTVSRSTYHCQEAQQILNEVAVQDLQQTLSKENRIVVKQLLNLSEARQKQVIRLVIQRDGNKMPSQAQLTQALYQLKQPELSTLAVKLGDIWLRHFQGEVYITNELADVSNWHVNITMPIQGQVSVDLPDNLGSIVISTTLPKHSRHTQSFSLPEDVNTLRIQFKHTNPKVLPDYRSQRRSLKKLWQELAVPTWQRSRIPLLFSQNELVAAAGQFVCQPFKQADYRQTYYLNWLA